MNPTPRKLAVLISLLGIGSPWPNIAFGADAGVSAPLTAGITSRTTAIRAALSLFDGPKPAAAIIAHPRNLAASHPKRSTGVAHRSAKAATQVLPAIVVTAKAMRFTEIPTVASISFTPNDELYRAIEQPAPASPNGVAPPQLASAAGLAGSNSEAGEAIAPNYENSVGSSDPIKNTWDAQPTLVATIDSQQSSEASNRNRDSAATEGRVDQGTLARARVWLAAQSTAGIAPPQEADKLAQVEQTVLRRNKVVEVPQPQIDPTLALSPTTSRIVALSEQINPRGEDSYQSLRSAGNAKNGNAQDSLDAVHSALLELLWQSDALLSTSTTAPAQDRLHHESLGALHNAILDLWEDEPQSTQAQAAAPENLDRDVLETLHYAHLDPVSKESLQPEPPAASLDSLLDRDMLEALHFALLDRLTESEALQSEQQGAATEPLHLDGMDALHDVSWPGRANEPRQWLPLDAAAMKKLDRDVLDALHYAQLDLLKALADEPEPAPPREPSNVRLPPQSEQQGAATEPLHLDGMDALHDVLWPGRANEPRHWLPLDAAAMKKFDRDVLDALHYAQLDLLKALADEPEPAPLPEPSYVRLPLAERLIATGEKPPVAIADFVDASKAGRSSFASIAASIQGLSSVGAEEIRMPPMPKPERASAPEPALRQVDEIELAGQYKNRMRAEDEDDFVYTDRLHDAAGANSLRDELLALSDNKLEEMRGGFETDTGLKISFGIERAVYINGNLVTTTSLNISDLSKLSAGQASIGGLNAASMALVQNGPGNTFLSSQLSPGNVGTVVQNTLNDQNIQGVTVINATVNSLELVKSADLRSSIRAAVIDSLRR